LGSLYGKYVKKMKRMKEETVPSNFLFFVRRLYKEAKKQLHDIDISEELLVTATDHAYMHYLFTRDFQKALKVFLTYFKRKGK